MIASKYCELQSNFHTEIKIPHKSPQNPFSCSSHRVLERKLHCWGSQCAWFERYSIAFTSYQSKKNCTVRHNLLQQYITRTGTTGKKHRYYGQRFICSFFLLLELFLEQLLVGQKFPPVAMQHLHRQ